MRMFEMVRPEFAKNKDTAPNLPRRSTSKSAGHDFFLQEDVQVNPGKVVVTWTDVKVRLNDDEMLKIHIRSSLGIKYQLMIANGTGVIDCVPKGTLISTPNGDKKIEDIFNSTECELVLSYNEETNEIENDVVGDVWIVTDLELLEIETVDGDNIKIPLKKEVYTERGWVKAEKLTINDKILKI